MQNKGTQGVQVRYDTELPPFIYIVRHPGCPVILGTERSAHRNKSEESYRRGIVVGVKGVTGRDAIAHKRQRNSSQWQRNSSRKELVARHFTLFSRVLRRKYCAIVAH